MISFLRSTSLNSILFKLRLVIMLLLRLLLILFSRVFSALFEELVTRVLIFIVA